MVTSFSVLISRWRFCALTALVLIGPRPACAFEWRLPECGYGALCSEVAVFHTTLESAPAPAGSNVFEAAFEQVSFSVSPNQDPRLPGQGEKVPELGATASIGYQGSPAWQPHLDVLCLRNGESDGVEGPQLKVTPAIEVKMNEKLALGGSAAIGLTEATEPRAAELHLAFAF